MGITILTAAVLFSAQAASYAPDQTSDARLLLNFVDAVKRGAMKEAEMMLAPGAFVGNYAQKKPTTVAEFAVYARACQLRQVDVVTGSRMPIGVKWLCPYPEYERNASFWFEGQSISRIGWGKPMVIQIPPVKNR